LLAGRIILPAPSILRLSDFMEYLLPQPGNSILNPMKSIDILMVMAYSSKNNGTTQCPLTKAALIERIYNSKDLSKTGSARTFDFFLDIMKKAIKSRKEETPRQVTCFC
jgi:hypothetical protein